MKNRNLFICETPFQVLASLLLIYESLSNDVNDFIIVDTMTDYLGIAKRLNHVPVIDYAFPATANGINEQDSLRILNRIKYAFPVFTKLWSYKKGSEMYDSIYCRNYTTPITEAAYRHFKKNNSDLALHIIDEGYSSYLSLFWNSHNHISAFHRFSNFILSGHRNYMYNRICDALFFAPDLFNVQIPFPVKHMLSAPIKLTEEQLKTINDVFGYNCSNTVNDNQFIYFEECFSFDDDNNNDINIVESISKIVGKENIKIKLHPRSKIDRFSPLGYDVLKSSNYPWEVFALNNTNKAIVLLAYSSGALMNYLFLTDSRMKSVLLYKLFPDRYKHINDKELLCWLEGMRNRYEECLFAPQDFSEFKEILYDSLNSDNFEGKIDIDKMEDNINGKYYY